MFLINLNENIFIAFKVTKYGQFFNSLHTNEQNHN